MRVMSQLSHVVQHEDARLCGEACRVCRRCPPPAIEEELDRAAGGLGGKRQRRKKARRRETGPAPNATPAGAGGSVLPGWRGWSPAVRLSTLLRLRQQLADRRRLKRPQGMVPNDLLPFFLNGHALYRISKSGEGRPVSIGQVRANNNVAERLRQHVSGSDGDPRVRRALRGMDRRKVWVQIGKVNRVSLDARIMHAYEIWLQKRENIRLYQPDTTTFDEFEANDDGVWFDVA